MISPVIKNSVTQSLEQRLNTPILTINFRPVNGGDINSSFQVLVNNQFFYFCKINSANSLPQLFQKEMNGLRILDKQCIFRIPEVIACYIVNDYQVLLMEWIKPGTQTDAYWKLAGERLAALHRITQKTFGLDEDNYMGSLHQSNAVHNDWISFFINERLEPQVKAAMDSGLFKMSDYVLLKNRYNSFADIFPPEQPSLLHGDLWSGNLLADNTDQPVLIDPAVYFGHRSVDLAMTTLFGGFGPGFYEAYHYHFPLPANHRRQWDFCNLYPLLVHLNLFGSSYLPRFLAIIKRV